MATKRFAIYYANGSVYEGGGENDEFVEVTFRVSRDWLNAPADRVIGVIVDTETRHVLRGTEWYYFLEDGEFGYSDDIGAWLRKFGGAVKRGEWITDKEFLRFVKWTKEYQRIPRPKPPPR